MLAPTGPLSDVDRGLIAEPELGEGGMATVMVTPNPIYVRRQ